MNISERVFIALIRKGLWNTAIVIPESFSDWKSVIKVAQSQSVLGTVGHAVLSEDFEGDVPQELKDKLRMYLMRNAVVSNALEVALVQVVSTLREKGISSVLLKGQGNAQYYPFSEMRQCGDVDLYIGQENYEKAYDILKSLASDIDDKKELTRGKHFHMVLGKVRFDIHRFSGLYTLPIYNKKYQEESDKGLTSKLVEMSFRDTIVMTPSDEFNAYYIFNHLFNHFMTSGIGLRHLCDLMLFLHSKAGLLDLVELKKILVKMDMLYPWQVFGNLLVKHLGMNASEFPFYDDLSDRKSEKVLAHILKEGNFGRDTNYYNRKQGSYLRRKFNSLKWYCTRSFNLFTLFPKQSLRNLLNMVSLGVLIVATDLDVCLRHMQISRDSREIGLKI